MQYDKSLIEEVVREINGLPQVTQEDFGLLFPPHSPIDFIADEPVDFSGANGALTEWRFKGIINKPRSSPLTIRLCADTSSERATHTLAIAHSLNVRANQDNSICRTYELDLAHAIRIAELHRRFYEMQDPNHVHKINSTLEKRELRRQYDWQRFVKK